MQRADASAIAVERRRGLAFCRLGEIFDRGNDVTHGLLEIRREVAVTHNSFVSVEVNQNEWPVLKQTYLRDHRSLQGHNDGPRPNTLERQSCACHGDLASRATPCGELRYCSPAVVIRPRVASNSA